MSEAIAYDWQEANQNYLTAVLGVVKATLENYISGKSPEHSSSGLARQALSRAADMLPAPAALDNLCAAFNLSPFERDVLLLCAGMEMDSSFAPLCAEAQGNSNLVYPTFSLALAALPEAHWSALIPAAPLRRWRLIVVENRGSLTTSPLRIDERVLHYLAGVQYLEESLQGYIEPVQCFWELPPSQRDLSKRIINIWSNFKAGAVLPVIQLSGCQQSSMMAIAASACNELGIRLHSIRASDIPVAVSERETLARLWEREAILSESALIVEYDEMDGNENTRAVLSFVENVQGMLLVSGHKPLSIKQRPCMQVDVPRPCSAEQRSLWYKALSPVLSDKLSVELEPVLTHFSLSAKTIQDASIEVLGYFASGGRLLSPAPGEFGRMLWDICRARVRPRLEGLAQRIQAASEWDDLVLPEQQLELLREIAVQVRQHYRVSEEWGFAGKSARGLGISALFAGPSGTGKTLAAEVLANELQLDLYRIDLSSVVSKYIGETEKNLRRVFDAAEGGGAILLFDEADALFGKRTEVRDSHDRYANVEISYLLQRMESYKGLSILTTNMKSALDTAFLRRIRFIIQFPFPDVAQRAAIWQRIFPANTPTAGLDTEKLARLNVTGGNIRNIALNAAYLAAEAGEPVRMEHLLQAARNEYVKLEKPLSNAEIGGWV